MASTPGAKCCARPTGNAPNRSGCPPSTRCPIPVDEALVRPIHGGSGVYAGASGWARTERRADDTWRHTFFLLPTPRR